MFTVFNFNTDKLTANARLSENRTSERKEALRKTQLYDDLNLKELLISFFKVPIFL